jgi:hypothetical protein
MSRHMLVGPRVHAALVTTLMAVVAGCGGESTAPGANVSGQWSYEASNISGSGVTCNISGMTLTLNQSGSTFSGTANAGGTLSCSNGVSTFTDPLGSDVVANGQISGNSVQFDIGTSDIHNSGTLSGNSISGIVTLRVVSNGTTVILTGNFASVRQ